MKAGWKTNTLENCLERFRVPAKIQRKQFRKTGAFPIVSQEADFVNGYWDEAGDVCVLDRPVVIFGDHTQVLKYVDFDFVVGADGVKVLAPKPFIDAKYLYYFVMANRTPSLGYARHYRHVKELVVNYPDAKEQQRIVAVLDEAFEGLVRARENAEENLKNARELFESVLKQVFDDGQTDDPVHPISEIATVTSSKRVMKKDYVESGVPFLRTKEVKQLSNGEPITTELFISRSHFEELKERNGAPIAGDVLITAIGTIGEIYVVQHSDEFYFKDGNVLWLKEMQSVSPHFLRYSLLNFVKEIQSLSHGAAYNALPIAKLKSHTMRIPNRDEQLHLVEKLDATNKEARLLQAFYKNKLEDLDDLRQSLLQKAFAGELP